MFSAILIALLLLFIVYVMFAPVYIILDTASHDYSVRFPGLLKLSLESHEQELIRIKLRTLFSSFYVYPLNIGGRKGSLKPRRKKNKNFNIQKAIRVVKSFKVTKLNVDVDTGDCITNAKLYPLFGFLNAGSGHFTINFQGKNRLALHLMNRPARIIKSFINL